MFKKCILLVFILSSKSLLAQETQILKLLNQQLYKEIKNYPHEDSLSIIKPFTITKNKVLTYEIKKYNSYIQKWQIIKTQVPLSKITGFIKDINVIFEVESKDAVETTQTITKTNKTISTNSINTNLFFTSICKETNNEYLKEAMLKAFKNAGYNITSAIWAD